MKLLLVVGGGEVGYALLLACQKLQIQLKICMEQELE